MKIEDFYTKLIKFLSLLVKLEEEPCLIIAKDKKIYYKSNDIDFEYIDVVAKFYSKNNIIYVNLDKHINKSHNEIVSVIHEYRHFYQFKQIEKSNKNSMVKVWEKNFAHYIPYGENRIL